MLRNSNYRLFAQRGGFTLVEIMVSSLVFCIALLALLSIYTQSTSSGLRAEYAYTAHNLARSHLETLRSVSFNDLAAATESSTAINAYGVVDSDGKFLRSTSVSTNYTGDSNLTQVTVSVNYTFRGAQSPSAMQVSSVFYSNG